MTDNKNLEGIVNYGKYKLNKDRRLYLPKLCEDFINENTDEPRFLYLFLEKIDNYPYIYAIPENIAKKKFNKIWSKPELLSPENIKYRWYKEVKVDDNNSIKIPKVFADRVLLKPNSCCLITEDSEGLRIYNNTLLQNYMKVKFND